jgi:hypothetical protein
MKRSFFIFLLLINAAYAQKWETQVKLSSGLFHFVGTGVDQTSFINQSDPPEYSSTNNPYGSKNGLCLGLVINFQRLTSYYFVYGLNVDWESLQSKAPLEYIDNNQISWSGRTFLRRNFCTFIPHLGFRVPVKTFVIEASTGLDFAIPLLKARESGKATSNDGQTIKTNLERPQPPIDFRSSFQIAGYADRYGLSIAYAIGKVNYLGEYVGAGDQEILSRYLKIGLQYRLNK